MRAPVGRETLAKGGERPQTGPDTGKSGGGSAKFDLGYYDLGRSPSRYESEEWQQPAGYGKFHVSYRNRTYRYTLLAVR